MLKDLTDVILIIPVGVIRILFGRSVMVLYKKVTSVIRCCQTNLDTCGTTGTSGTSLEVLVVLQVLEVHGHCNLIGNAKQYRESLPGVSFQNY